MAGRARHATRIAALVFGLLLSAPARADDNHYQNFLVGDRAAGMGGAFTAISDDSSGGFYNPAGLAEAPHSSVSLSAAVYGYASRLYGVEQLSYESDNSSFISYPTTAAWIQRVRKGREDGTGRVQIAVSLVSPQSDASRIHAAYERPLAQIGKTKTGVKLDSVSVRISEDDTLWIGVSAAWKIFKHLTVGASIFLTYRTGLYQDHGVSLATLQRMSDKKDMGSYGLALWRDIRLTHFALVGVLGVVVPITDGLRVGLSFRTPSAQLHGSADLKYFGTVDAETRKVAPKTLDIPEAGFNDRQPFKTTVGVAYISPRSWGASVDFSLHGPAGEYGIFDLGDAQNDLSQAAFGRLRMQKKLVWQLNVGAEYYIGQIVPVRLGFFTNLSSLDPPQECNAGVCHDHFNMFTDQVDLYGVSGSVGIELYNVALNLGLSYNAGTKTITVEVGGVQTEVDLGRSFMLVSIGGAFRF